MAFCIALASLIIIQIKFALSLRTTDINIGMNFVNNIKRFEECAGSRFVTASATVT